MKPNRVTVAARARAAAAVELRILPSSLQAGGVFYPARVYDGHDLEFVPGMGRVIVIGKLVARRIHVGKGTQLHTFDHIACKSFRSECDVTLYTIEAEDFVDVDGRLGTVSCKAKRIDAGGAITAAWNVEAVYQISTRKSINVGGHIICTEGPIMAADGINCGNTITAGGEIVTTNAVCAGACTWRRNPAKPNDMITATAVRAAQVIGQIDPLRVKRHEGRR